MKIFGIGLHRTGTTSLIAAMRMMGFTTCHFPRSTNEIDEVDFSDDVTVACRFVDLDRRHPGSRFIFTVREEEAWIDSCRRFYRRLNESGVIDFTGEATNLILYGVPRFDEAAWRRGRQRHEEMVRDYFAARPEELLVMDICAGDGWEKLLPFVAGLRPFPRENVFQAEMEALTLLHGNG